MPVVGVDFRDLPKKCSLPDADGIWLVKRHCQRIRCQLLDVEQKGTRTVSWRCKSFGNSQGRSTSRRLLRSRHPSWLEEIQTEVLAPLCKGTRLLAKKEWRNTTSVWAFQPILCVRTLSLCFSCRHVVSLVSSYKIFCRSQRVGTFLLVDQLHSAFSLFHPDSFSFESLSHETCATILLHGSSHPSWGISSWHFSFVVTCTLDRWLCLDTELCNHTSTESNKYPQCDVMSCNVMSYHVMSCFVLDCVVL